MTETILADVDGTANRTSNIVPNNGANVSLWAKGTTLSAGTATVKLQWCNKKSTVDADWIDLEDSTVTLAVTATGYGSAIIACCGAYIRAVYTKNSNATGTIEAIINFQR